MAVTHRALDGRRFRFSGQLDLGAPFTSAVEMDIAGHRHEFTAGSLGLGDDVARALGIEEYDEELSYQGGALSTARTRPYDPQIRLREDRLTGVWRGRRHSLVTHLYGGSTRDLLGVLRTVRVEQYDDGLALRPVSGSAFAAPAAVTKQVPGLGLLEVSPLTRQHAEQLPRWKGLSTRSGELFRDSLSDGEPYFVLATTDVWVTVLPLPDTALDRVPELVGQLRLQTAA